MKALRTLTHPASLLIFTAVSVLLWMPFGIGYYEWPWKSALMRLLIQFFAIGFALLALAGSVLAARPRLAVARLIIALFSLAIAFHGIFALYQWMSKYVRPMLRKSNAATAQVTVFSSTADLKKVWKAQFPGF